MLLRFTSLSFCLLLCLTDIRAGAQCGPNMEKQIGDVRDSWVKNWNDGQLGKVVNLYYKYADLLGAEGTRAHGSDEIRAALLKKMGSKVEVHTLAFACSDAFAYENGTYTQTENGQSIDGNYLVVLVWKESKWQIVQHASTASGRLK